MMLCIDGSDIESVFFALAKRDGEQLRVVHAQQVPRRLGDELRLMQEFLLAQGCDQASLHAVGLVIGPGSSGALRSTLSLVNAWALGKGLLVTTVERAGDIWSVVAFDKPFVLPVYERAAHTTPSHKDALGRKVSP
jgi:tRNA A37 threonylcarbamoyladenosine modification protein TsaB